MKKILIALAVFTAVLSCKVQDEGAIVKIGDNVPAFELNSETYGTVSAADLKGKVTLICFFATWCPPCQLELAAIQNELLPKFGNNPDFRLIVAGRDHTDEELAEYNETKGLTFALYPDPHKEAYSLFASKSIPRSYVINKEGKVIDAALGFEEDHFEDMMELIEESL